MEVQSNLLSLGLRSLVPTWRKRKSKWNPEIDQEERILILEQLINVELVKVIILQF